MKIFEAGVYHRSRFLSRFGDSQALWALFVQRRERAMLSFYDSSGRSPLHEISFTTGCRGDSQDASAHVHIL
nr:hypothetical protein CFP56_54956 [Quercus suber]